MGNFACLRCRLLFFRSFCLNFVSISLHFHTIADDDGGGGVEVIPQTTLTAIALLYATHKISRFI